MSKKKKRNMYPKDSLSGDVEFVHKSEGDLSNPHFTQINYKNNDLDKHVQDMKEENIHLRKIIDEKEKLLVDKDKLITQLIRENKTLQDNYDLIISNIVEKDTIMESLNRLNQKIDKVEKNLEQRPTYSQIVKNTNYIEKYKNEAEVWDSEKSSIIIKPMKTQDNRQTMRELESGVDPVNLKLKINHMKNLGNGTIKIQCNSKNDSDKLKEAISSKLGDKYLAEENILKKPKIKIVGVKLDHEWTKTELQKTIIEQNSIIDEIDSFEIEHIKYVAFKKTYVIFVNVNGNLFKKIMCSGNKLFLGWQSCTVYDNNRLIRCFKCQGFNHTQSKCRNKLMCSFCAGEHSLDKCNLNECEKKCGNCFLANQKYKKGYNTFHSTDDIANCESLKYFEKANISRISFHE